MTKTTLGNFSISLAVKDIAASIAFYSKLGFEKLAGDGKRFVVMQCGTTTIGLFQGMFDKNILTFNPGWDNNAQALVGSNPRWFVIQFFQDAHPSPIVGKTIRNNDIDSLIAKQGIKQL